MKQVIKRVIGGAAASLSVGSALFWSLAADLGIKLAQANPANNPELYKGLTILAAQHNMHGGLMASFAAILLAALHVFEDDRT